MWLPEVAPPLGLKQLWMWLPAVATPLLPQVAPPLGPKQLRLAMHRGLLKQLRRAMHLQLRMWLPLVATPLRMARCLRLLKPLWMWLPVAMRFRLLRPLWMATRLKQLRTWLPPVAMHFGLLLWMAMRLKQVRTWPPPVALWPLAWLVLRRPLLGLPGLGWEASYTQEGQEG